MSKLAEFRAVEKALQEQLAQFEALKGDAGLKKEIEFEEKLKNLMQSYGKSLKDIIAILDPVPSSRKQEKAVGAHRRPRTLKRYKNPHSGEVVETKGGNHRVLKEWKAEYGAATVESWLQG
ncbi:TPA: DNA binding protein [Pseudomonas aeruginosa]|nr:DNA binding protein [Pseudomonas aeruginosa]